MKDRIRQLMLDKGMTQKTLASELCIAEATLSGIFTGRTRPTHLTVNAIHERFPEVNISWLMFNEGEMYNSISSSSSGQAASENTKKDADFPTDLFADISAASESKETLKGSKDVTFQNDSCYTNSSVQGANGNATTPEVAAPQIKYIEKYIDKPRRKITEIRIFFDDGTYETFTP